MLAPNGAMVLSSGQGVKINRLTPIWAIFGVTYFQAKKALLKQSETIPGNPFDDEFLHWCVTSRDVTLALNKVNCKATKCR